MSESTDKPKIITSKHPFKLEQNKQGSVYLQRYEQHLGTNGFEVLCVETPERICPELGHIVSEDVESLIIHNPDSLRAIYQMLKEHFGEVGK